MVKHPIVRLDTAFAALAHPTRRSMIERLAAGPATVGELAEPHALSLPAISKHVAVLERGGWIRRRRKGRTQVCTLEAAAFTQALRWMHAQRSFWEARLDALARVVEPANAKEETWRHRPPTRSGSNGRSRRRRKPFSAPGRRRGRS